jgi:hypothetical protein
MLQNIANMLTPHHRARLGYAVNRAAHQSGRVPMKSWPGRVSLRRTSSPVSPRERPFIAAAVVATVFSATFVLRWLTLDFDNDYFMHMSWAAEMVHGEWPVRDFVEPGFPLQTWLAYAGLRIGGYQLSWEGVLACSLIASSSVLTYVVSRQLGVPRWLALLVTTVAAATYPRLYAYPKAFVYPFAVWALLGYFRNPNRRTLFLVASATAIAFLFRHDHGVWITGPTVLGLALFHWSQPRTLTRAILSYGIVATLLVSPWLAWVAASGHADQYWDFLLERSQGLTDRARVPVQRFDLDRGAPLLTLAPIEFPVVGIRWAPAVSPAERLQREHRYSLRLIPSTEDRYRLTNLDSDNVRALLLDVAVEDTAGISRASLRVPEGGFSWIYLQLQRYIPLIRLRVLPGIVKPANAEQWLTDLTFGVPWVVLLVALVSLISIWKRGLDSSATILIVVVAVLSIVTYQTLIRASPDSRLGDIVALTGILLAWLIWRMWSVSAWPRYPLRAVAIVLLALTVISAFSFGRVFPRLGAVGVNGPTNLTRRLFGVGTLYGGRPLDLYSPPGATGLPGLSRWLNECTAVNDRVSIIGFEPQVFFVAERGFAGGLAFYDLGWNSSERDQALTIERWSRQRVPVILAMETEWESFSRDYPMVRAWIDERYEVVKQSAFEGTKRLRVFRDRSFRPVRQQPATGLPCFR